MIMVIVPAFNEADSIGRVVRGLFEHGYYDVVVVDDGSSDDTAKVSEEAGATVIRHPINRGQGAALETGNRYAYATLADIVVHFDGDGQFNPADIAGAIERVKSGKVEVVLGSRFLDNRSNIPWFKRKVLLPVSRWINYVFTRLHLTDVHNGFRVLSRSALEKITITHDGMAHNTEIPAQIKKHNLSFEEYPVEVRYFEPGQGIRGGLIVLKDLLVAKIIER